jgi:hypothetical protein
VYLDELYYLQKEINERKIAADIMRVRIQFSTEPDKLLEELIGRLETPPLPEKPPEFDAAGFERLRNMIASNSKSKIVIKPDTEPS